MNRRGFMGWLGAAAALLAGAGGARGASDGVALYSAAHPIGPPLPEADIDPESLTWAELEFPVYAQAGETITCEQGHPICSVVETVYVGQIQDLDRQFGDWRQKPPPKGSMLPVRCMSCGARWCETAGIFHFKDGWRNPNGLLIRPDLRIVKTIGGGS